MYKSRILTFCKEKSLKRYQNYQKVYFSNHFLGYIRTYTRGKIFTPTVSKSIN